MRKIIISSLVLSSILFIFGRNYICYSTVENIKYEKDYNINKYYKINSTYKDSNIQLVVFDAAKLSSNALFVVEEGKIVYRVCVNITNLTDKYMAVEYPICFADNISCTSWKYGKFYNTTIKPNTTECGFVYYEVPESTKNVKLFFEDLNIAYIIQGGI